MGSSSELETSPKNRSQDKVALQLTWQSPALDLALRQLCRTVEAPVALDEARSCKIGEVQRGLVAQEGPQATVGCL